MAIGVEIVVDKVSKKPWKRLAEEMMYKMKERKLLVALCGIYGNVITLTPPLCFTHDNAKTVVDVFDGVLGEIEAEEEATESQLGGSSSSKDNDASSRRKRKMTDIEGDELTIYHCYQDCLRATEESSSDDDDDDDDDHRDNPFFSLDDSGDGGGRGNAGTYEDMD